MPNKFQFAFLAAFFSTFLSLLLLARALRNLLLDAGYNPSNLILLGTPGHELNLMDNLRQFLESTVPPHLHVVTLPAVGQLDLIQLASSPVFLATSVLVLVSAVYATLFTAPSKPLDPKVWKRFPLAKKIKVSPNTAIYRFKLPRSSDVLGLPIGQHITVSAEINGRPVVRSYTPISNDDDRGYFELIVKTYEKGNISKHIGELKIGDNLNVKGPKGNFLYTPNLVSHLSLLAGGTGIAPMIQVIRAVLKEPTDKTTLSLIYANVNPEDILLKDDLDELVVRYPTRFKVYYVLNNPSPGWTGGVGFVTKDHIKEHLPNPATTNSKLLICGPPPMVTAMKKNLADLEYPVPATISKPADKVFVF